MLLHQLLVDSAQKFPDRTAVEESDGGSITYRELELLSDRLRDVLTSLGVHPGDRVGVYLRKSVDAVASIFGILKTGAAYVPVDPGAPPARNAYILSDCTVKVVLIESLYVDKLSAEFGSKMALPTLLILDGVGSGNFLRSALERGNSGPPTIPTCSRSTMCSHRLSRADSGR